MPLMLTQRGVCSIVGLLDRSTFGCAVSFSDLDGAQYEAEKGIAMTNPARIIRFLALIITCATLGYAQESGPTAKRAFELNREIETSYDEHKDVTTVRLSPMQVYGEPIASSNYIGRDEAQFYASFTYSGRTLKVPPDRVLISLISSSEDWKYTDFRKPLAFVDGKRLKLGPLEHLPSFTVNAPASLTSDDYIKQEIAISVPYKTFLRVANGNKVQIRMGPREFKLEKSHLESLRGLASWMVR
jgi:hypothetical protein